MDRTLKGIIITAMAFMILTTGTFAGSACAADTSCGVTKTDVIKTLIAYSKDIGNVQKTHVYTLMRAYVGAEDCDSTEVGKAKQMSNSIDEDIIPTCTDGTPLSHCAEDTPKYCYEGNLVDRCDLCCLTGICGPDGECSDIIDTDTAECSDTDRGRDYRTKGTLTDFYGKQYEDECEGDILKERYCTEKNQAGIVRYDCVGAGYDGCEDGQCYGGESQSLAGNNIDCITTYGDIYWCADIEVWETTCQDIGEAKSLEDDFCTDSDGTQWSYCITCHDITKLESPCPPYGDADYDGWITSNDVEVILAYSSNGEALGEDFERSDLDDNNKIELGDTEIIQQYIEGSIDTFPVCSREPSVGMVCETDEGCPEDTECKLTAMYDGSGEYTERYCCANHECASGAQETCVSIGGWDQSLSPIPNAIVNCTYDKSISNTIYILDCKSTFGTGYVCGNESDYDVLNDTCSNMDATELENYKCSNTITGTQYCMACNDEGGDSSSGGSGSGSDSGCTDSDGIDYYVTGTTSLGDEIKTDECNLEGDLIEYYCNEGEITSNVQSCIILNAAGCENGMCVPALSESAGGAPGTCEETDNVRDHETKGTINSAVNLDCERVDKCEDDTYLDEYYCDGDYYKTERFNCVEAGYAMCYQGVCVNTVPEEVTCSDTDGGRMRELLGTVTGVSSGDKTDTCEDEETLIEYFCRDNNVINYTYECTCLGYDGCKDGACYSSDSSSSPQTTSTRSFSTTGATGNSKSDCTDSDSGIDTSTFGETVDYNYPGILYVEDRCLDAYTIREYYCGEYDLRSVDIECPNGCENGKCLTKSTVSGTLNKVLYKIGNIV